MMATERPHRLGDGHGQERSMERWSTTLEAGGDDWSTRMAERRDAYQKKKPKKPNLCRTQWLVHKN